MRPANGSKQNGFPVIWSMSGTFSNDKAPGLDTQGSTGYIESTGKGCFVFYPLEKYVGLVCESNLHGSFTLFLNLLGARTASMHAIHRYTYIYMYVLLDKITRRSIRTICCLTAPPHQTQKHQNRTRRKSERSSMVIKPLESESNM